MKCITDSLVNSGAFIEGIPENHQGAPGICTPSNDVLEMT